MVKGDITSDAIAYKGSSTKTFGTGIGYIFKPKSHNKLYELSITSYQTSTLPFNRFIRERMFIKENGYQFEFKHSSVFLKSKNDNRLVLLGANYQYYHYSRDFSFNLNPINNINTKLNSYSIGVSGALYQRIHRRLYYSCSFLYDLFSYDQVIQRRVSFAYSNSGFDLFSSIKMNFGFAFRVF